MRYVIIKYAQKADGKYDESFIISEKIKNKDLDYATVILDYATRTVVKMRLPNATQEDRKFTKISDFYKEHYQKQIEELEQIYEIRDKLVDMVANKDDESPKDKKEASEIRNDRDKK